MDTWIVVTAISVVTGVCTAVAYIVGRRTAAPAARGRTFVPSGHKPTELVVTVKADTSQAEYALDRLREKARRTAATMHVVNRMDALGRATDTRREEQS